ncbi:hypothetical protein ACPCTO_26735 [Streptomyces olivoreticuli]
MAAVLEREWGAMGKEFSWGRTLGCAASVAALMAGPEALPAAAHTSDAIVSCAGSNTIEFSPGLSLQARHTRISGSGAYSCLSADPDLKWGKSVITGGGSNGCFISDATTVEHITWNTGETTAVVYRLGNVQQVAGQAVVLVTGRVTSGKFEGRTVTSPGFQLTVDPLRCASAKGVQLITGPSTLLIV